MMSSSSHSNHEEHQTKQQGTQSHPQRSLQSPRRTLLKDGLSMEELRGWAIQMMEAYGLHEKHESNNSNNNKINNIGGGGETLEGDSSSMNDLLRAARDGKTRNTKVTWLVRLSENDPEFTRLDLSAALLQQLSDFERAKLLHALPLNETVQIVHLSGLQLLEFMTEQEIQQMVQGVGHLKRLEEIFIFRGGNHVLSEELLAQAVESAKKLRVLMMWGYGHLGQHPELARVLRCHQGLERITITLPKNCPYACMDVCVMGLAEMPNLQCLNLRGTGKQEEPAISPEAMHILLGSRSIESLYLENLGLIDDHTDAICEELRENQVLGLLDLKDNFFSDDALFTFAQTLPHNATLQSLDLSGVQVTDRGGRALAQGLAANSTLTYLELEGTLDKYADEFNIKTEHHDKDWFKALDYQLRLNRAGTTGNRKKFVQALNSVSDHLGCLFTLVRQSPQYCDLHYAPPPPPTSATTIPW